MYFDRFDIIQAHYWWNIHHHGGWASYEYLRYHNIRKLYSPGASESTPNSKNAVRIYNNLCEQNNCCHNDRICVECMDTKEGCECK